MLHFLSIWFYLTFDPTKNSCLFIIELYMLLFWNISLHSLLSNNSLFYYLKGVTITPTNQYPCWKQGTFFSAVLSFQHPGLCLSEAKPPSALITDVAHYSGHINLRENTTPGMQGQWGKTCFHSPLLHFTVCVVCFRLRAQRVHISSYEEKENV